MTAGSGDIVMTTERQRWSLNHTIPASDWLRDFAPHFGMGRFVLFEFPQVEVSPEADVSPEVRPVVERLRRAIGRLEALSKQMEAGEWTRVVELARQVAEELRAYREADALAVRTLLIQDGLTEAAADALISTLRGLFEYTSKFLHVTDRQHNSQPLPKASKEDAYLAFSVTVAVVNALTAKVMRHRIDI